MSVLNSFYEWVILYSMDVTLFIYQLMAFWSFPLFNLWILLLWTIMYSFGSNMFSFGYILGSGFRNSCGNCWTFGGTTGLFFWAVGPIYHLMVYKDYNFFLSLKHLLLSVLSILAILVGIKWYLVMVLIYIFWWLVCWTSFHVLISHIYAIFGEMSIQNHCPFLNLVVFLFAEL